MGARPLRRAIQRYIEDPLADFLLARAARAGHGHPRRPARRRHRAVRQRRRGRAHRSTISRCSGSTSPSSACRPTPRSRRPATASPRWPKCPARARPSLRPGAWWCARTTSSSSAGSAAAKRRAGWGAAPTAGPGTRSPKSSYRSAGGGPGRHSRPGPPPSRKRRRRGGRAAPFRVFVVGRRALQQRHPRARPRARRRHRARLARAARRRSRHRQVDAAATGARASAPRRAERPVMLRLGRGVAGAGARCAPTAPAGAAGAVAGARRDRPRDDRSGARARAPEVVRDRLGADALRARALVGAAGSVGPGARGRRADHAARQGAAASPSSWSGT